MQPESDPPEAPPGLTRKSPFAPTARLCPRCLTPLQRGSKLGGWLIPQDYICSSCGYRGVVYVEKDIQLRSGDERQP